MQQYIFSVLCILSFFIPCAFSDTSVPDVFISRGVQPVTFGSARQAQALLEAIQNQPGKNSYQIHYATEVDTVVFGCDFEENVLMRIHSRPDGHGTFETWKGDINARLKSAAEGGSLNSASLWSERGSMKTF